MSQINVEPSIRLLKLFWWFLEEGNDGISFEYLRRDPAQITVKGTLYNIQNIIDWVPPYAPAPAKLKIFLRYVASYLSRGNVSGPIDLWIDATEGDDFGNKSGVRTALRAGGDLDTVSLSMVKAKEMLGGMNFLEEKKRLALAAATRVDQSLSEYIQADGLYNQVVRGTMSKMAALQSLDFLIAENEQGFWAFRQFLTLEPQVDEYEGVELLYGRNCFIQTLEEASIREALQEGRDQDMKVGLRTVEPRLISKLKDITFFENRFIHLMEIYTRIKNLRQEEEEMLLRRERLCVCLRKDILEFHKEANEETEGTTSSSVVKDLLEQLQSLNRRLLDIKTMADSEPNIPPLPFIESDPLDGALRSVNLPVSLFLQKIKKKLLELKDTIQDRKREEENRQKILLTEGLRLGPGRLKLLDLESRSNVLP